MLPGRLCIGILEEDNPFKSYFRVKPLLLAGENGFEPVDCSEIYPEDGCIRIVPDKNESSHFKTRMRRMGRYCVLDLRAHAGENDKIRPNKNYRVDMSERNTNIIYSDVVREPAVGSIYEIVDEIADGPWPGELPSTPDVLCGNALDIWYLEQDVSSMGYRAVMSSKKLNEADYQRFELIGFNDKELHFAVCRPHLIDEMMSRSAAVPVPEKEPVVPEKVEEVKPAEPEKPRLNCDAPRPPKDDTRRSPRGHGLEAQCGLNPRRGRSLQEIIEDKWRHSRVDQLGHPVPAEAMGQPVENPLERAEIAVREAWQIPELRAPLLQFLAETGDMRNRLDEVRRNRRDEALRRDLEDLEADRLRTLDEIDALKKNKNALRETLKQEIREEEAAALRNCTERTKAARAECARFEQEAREAGDAADLARDAFNALQDGRFEAKLREFALTSRAAELLAHPAKPAPVQPRYADTKPDAEAWIGRMCSAAKMQGLELDRPDAANLLILLALDRHIIISGSASSDKLPLARAVAQALGIADAGLYRELNGGHRKKPEFGEKQPLMVTIEDANRAPDADITLSLLEQENLILISLIDDAGSGFPVSADAFARAAMLRLEPARADLPWKAISCTAEQYDLPRPETLSGAFTADAGIQPSPAIQQKLAALRLSLAALGSRISRRALDRMWRYCSIMQHLEVTDEADALDRAFAQFALPTLLAEAKLECLAALPELLQDMPRCMALLKAPLPIMI